MSQQASLPHGWKAVLDENTGRHYYWHYKTNKVSWTRPASDSGAGGLSKAGNGARSVSSTGTGALSKLRSLSSRSSAKKSPKKISSAYSSGEKRNKSGSNRVASVKRANELRGKKDNSKSDLPDGWQAVMDPNTKRTYYWHRATNEVSWHHPSSAAAKTTPSAASQSTALKLKASAPSVPKGFKGSAEDTNDSSSAQRVQGTKAPSRRKMTDLLSPKSGAGLLGSNGQSPVLGKAGGKKMLSKSPEATANKSGRKMTARTFNRERQRRANVIAESFADDEHYQKKSFPKDAATRAVLTRVLHEHFLFHQLSPTELQEAVDAMKETRLTEAGSPIIKEGDNGDNFYVVVAGTFDVLVGGRKVGEIHENGAFGELALLYNCPRAASVVSQDGTTVVWGLDRATFRHMLRTSRNADLDETKRALRSVPLLKSLTEDQLTRCAETVRVVTFTAGENIIHKGDVGDVFYIIRRGEVNVTDVDALKGGAAVVFGSGDYFGERALLNDEPRAANVSAKTSVELLALDRYAFNDILGSLRELLDYNIRISVLQGVPLFRRLSPQERRELFEAFKTKTFRKGEYIIKQGDIGNTFYLVREGEAVVTQEVVISGRKTSTEVHILETGAYFGEMALIEGGIRQASVLARTSKCECFTLDRDHFEQLMGPVQAVLQRDVAERKDENAHKIADKIDELKQDLQQDSEAHTTSVGTAVLDLKKRHQLENVYHRSQRARARSTEERQRHMTTLKNLEILRTLGTGTFGRVKMVRHKITNVVYALKIQSKAQIVQYKLQTNIVNEKLIMESLRHPFILRLFTTFKDRDRQGGELFSLLQNRGQTLKHEGHRFYAGCVVSAFEHLHKRDILYRDLKPENLLIDTAGYIKVVDFGFAKVVKHRTYTLCGTPEYFSPELVLGKGYGKGNDYWAVGILIYEIINGFTPFGTCDDEQTVICRRICQSALKFPDDFHNKSARDIVSKLLTKDPLKRLGSNKEGVSGIKHHSFFHGMNWDSLVEKKLSAPWIPPIKDPLDASHFDEYDEEDSVPRYIDDGSKWDEKF